MVEKRLLDPEQQVAPRLQFFLRHPSPSLLPRAGSSNSRPPLGYIGTRVGRTIPMLGQSPQLLRRAAYELFPVLSKFCAGGTYVRR
jgi:hypothetical protein